MPPSRQAQQQQSVAPFIIAGGAVLGIASMVVFGAPGLVGLWAGLLVAAIAEPQPVFSGKRPGGGVQPEGPKEEANARRFDIMKDLRLRLILPNGDWLPGWKPQASWVAGILGGVAALALPVAEPVWAWANAAAVAVTVWAVSAARRRSGTPQDPCPGVRIDSNLLASVPMLAVAIVASLMTSLVLFMMWPSGSFKSRPLDEGEPVDIVFGALVPGVGPYVRPLSCLALGLLVGGLVVWSSWGGASLAKWRGLVAARQEWEARWAGVPSLSKNGSPTLVAHEEYGSLIVDTFEAPAAIGGAPGAIKAADQIAMASGAGSDVAVLPTPNVDQAGNPIFSSPHPSRFDVMTTGLGEMIDVADATIDEQVLNYVLAFAINAVFRANGMETSMLAQVEPLHEPPAPDEPKPRRPLLPKIDRAALRKRAEMAKRHGGGFWESLKSGEKLERTSAQDDGGPEGRPYAVPEPNADAPRAAWRVRLALGGNTMAQVRTAGPMIADILGTGVLVDDTVRPGDSSPRGPFRGTVVIGDLSATPEEIQPVLEAIMLENEWKPRWAQSLKQGANQPVPQYGATTVADYNGAEVVYTPHLIPQGSSLDEFRNYEAKLKTTVGPPPADFLTTIGFPGMDGQGGGRHPQALTIVYSTSPMPKSPQLLAPSPGSRVNLQRSTLATCPEHWILAWMINDAFKAARLPYPEVALVRHLTSPRSRLHLWRIKIRLFDGVTFGHVREAIEKIKSSLNAPWVRVAPDEDPQCIVLVAGEDYRKVRLLNPADDLLFLTDLEWQAAFSSARIRTESGLIPSVTAIGSMPSNDQVQVLDVALPPGVDREMLKKGLGKVKTATGNDFIEIRPGVGGASTVRLLVSEKDPMPTSAAPDFEEVDRSKPTAVPFATGVDGEPICFDWRASPHLAVYGMSGGGKSILLSVLLYGLAVKNCDIYVADPTKGGADFQFVMPWLKGFAATVPSAAAMMQSVYDEVLRRKSVNAEHGVGSYADLPEEIRPPHAVVMLDEFTSLISVSKPTKPESDDPDVLASFEQEWETYQSVLKIGSLAGRIAREARSAGVTLVLATQKLTADMLKPIPGSSDLRDNAAAILLGKAKYGAMQAAFKDAESVPDLGDSVPPGRGVFEQSGAPTALIQSWWTPDIQRVLAEQIAARRAPLDDTERIDLGTLVEAAHAKAGRTAIEGQIIEDPSAESVNAGLDVVDLGVLEMDDLNIDLSDLDVGVDEVASTLSADDEDLADEKVESIENWAPQDDLDEESEWDEPEPIDALEPADSGADDEEPEDDGFLGVSMEDNLVAEETSPTVTKRTNAADFWSSAPARPAKRPTPVRRPAEKETEPRPIPKTVLPPESLPPLTDNEEEFDW